MNKHIYALKVRSLCKKCGYMNIGSYALDEEIDIVCCGKCGAILAKPEGLLKDEESNIISLAKEIIEEGDDNVLL